MNDYGYSPEWHANEAKWSAEQKQECEVVRKAKELAARMAISNANKPKRYTARKIYDPAMKAAGYA